MQTKRNKSSFVLPLSLDNVVDDVLDDALREAQATLDLAEMADDVTVRAIKQVWAEQDAEQDA